MQEANAKQEKATTNRLEGKGTNKFREQLEKHTKHSQRPNRTEEKEKNNNKEPRRAAQEEDTSNEQAVEMLLDQKISLKNILDLCPRFKEKIQKKWMARMGQQLEESRDEVLCSMAQPEEATRTRDDNVARINVCLASQEIKGAILDGGSGVNIISEGMAIKLKLTWEPITFNVRMADNRTVVPK